MTTCLKAGVQIRLTIPNIETIGASEMVTERFDLIHTIYSSE